MEYGTYDIEASDWNNLEAIGLYDGENYWTTYEIKDAVNNMIDSNVTKWYAHNSGKYDIKFFLQHIMDNYHIEFIYNNSSLIRVMVYDNYVEKNMKNGQYKGNQPKYEHLMIDFRDSFAFFPVSLKRLTHGLEVEHAKQGYDQYQGHEDRVKMHEYLRYDVLGLYEAIEKFLDNTDSEEINITIASEAMKQYRNRYGGSEYMDNLQSNTSKEHAFRKAYFGGRTEVFTRYGEDLNYYDFSSMYPAVMKHNPYPCGEITQTQQFNQDKLGVYKVKVTAKDMKVPLLPKREDGKLKFPLGTFTGWYYSPELKKARELQGYDIKVLKGYYWQDKQYMFKDYIEHWYNKKQNSDGGMYLISKLFLNSLYGKFGQNREINEVVQRPPTKQEVSQGDWKVIDKDMDLYKRKKKIYSSYIYPFIAGFVTSYGRVKLFNSLQEAQSKGELYYCDTDSLVTSAELSTGSGLGALELEDHIKQGYFLFPKVYGYKDGDGETHLKGKGFKTNKLEYEDYVRAYNGDMQGFSHKWESIIGFLEGFSRDVAHDFKKKVKKKKTLKGRFDKRELVNKRETKPLVSD